MGQEGINCVVAEIGDEVRNLLLVQKDEVQGGIWGSMDHHVHWWHLAVHSRLAKLHPLSSSTDILTPLFLWTNVSKYLHQLLTLY